MEVVSVDKSGRFAKAGIQKGYIILKVNKLTINSEDDLTEAYQQVQFDGEERVLLITGVYPNGQVVYYAVDVNESGQNH